MESEGASKLTGSLLKILETGKATSTSLRGDLLTRRNAPTPDETSGEVLNQTDEVVVGARIVRRDSGESYEIVGIDDTRKVVQLRSGPDHTVSLGLADLQRKLETEGSPWHW